jgi:hypothetical protein
MMIFRKSKIMYSFFDYCLFIEENIVSVSDRIEKLSRIFLNNMKENSIDEEQAKKDILSNQRLGEPFIDFIYGDFKKLENTINKIQDDEKASLENAKKNPLEEPRETHTIPEFLRAIYTWRKKCSYE